MIRVGLTGGIGSGKSTVARVLELLGVPVCFADAQGRRLSDNDPEIILKIKSLFGEKAYSAGTLNRPWIARRVFSDPGLREGLNAIVHPAVRRDFRRWANERAEAPYLVLESAILLESGFDAEVDRIVVVTAPQELRIARVMERDGLDEASVRARIAAQMDDRQRLLRADYTLHADDRQVLIPQIVRLHETLRSGG